MCPNPANTDLKQATDLQTKCGINKTMKTLRNRRSPVKKIKKMQKMNKTKKTQKMPSKGPSWRALDPTN